MNGKITRRSVLRGMGASCLAAGAAPHVIPSGVLAWAGKAGANDRIILGGVGVRRMGAVLMQGFARLPGVRVAAVADVDLRIAQAIATPHREFARLLGGHPGMTAGEPADLTAVDHYQDYRRILDRDDIDAVVLGTPEHWHSLPSIHAAQAGKDVYCEKPLAQTIRVGHLGNIARWVSEKTGETGQRLQWDPQQERFTNSEWGNQFLDRPRRKPYQLPEQV